MDFLFALGMLTLLSAGIPSAHAMKEGGNTSGGGNGIDGTLVDLLPLMSPDKISGYKQVVAPTIQEIRERVPGFADHLEWLLTSKSWIMVPAGLERASSRITGLPFSSDQIARQTNSEIWISAPLFQSRLRGLTQKGAFIIHEALLSNFTELDEDAHAKVRRMTRVLMAKPFLDEAELAQEILNFCGQKYETATQIRERKAREELIENQEKEQQALIEKKTQEKLQSTYSITKEWNYSPEFVSKCDQNPELRDCLLAMKRVLLKIRNFEILDDINRMDHLNQRADASTDIEIVYDALKNNLPFNSFKFSSLKPRLTETLERVARSEASREVLDN
ncbi:hypothetical protein WDW37_20615 [Bdellovibrionota bacterium FG-1]